MSFVTMVIGSTAMEKWYSDFPRHPKDTDVICPKAAFLAAKEFDSERIEYIKENEHSAIIKWKDFGKPIEYLFSDNVRSFKIILTQMQNKSGYATPDVLYSLKKAHIHFPIKFQKHIKDLMFLRQKLREEKQISLEQDLMSESDLLEKWPALTTLHFLDTEHRVGKLKTPKMDQTTKEFFGKSKKYIKSYYEHDNMHWAIKHMQLPVYHHILKSNSEVETDHESWKMLSLQNKIWCVLEEVYVIALERKILPGLFDKGYKFNDQYNDPKQAFDWALMRVCTTLCNGFFREFAVRAYDEIQKQYNSDYVNLFFKNINKYEKEE
jgi:hypothetical protein